MIYSRGFNLLAILLLATAPLVIWSLITPDYKESDYEQVKILDEVVSIGVGEHIPEEVSYERTKFAGIDGDSIIFQEVSYGYKGMKEVESNHFVYQTTTEISIPGVREEVQVKIVGKDEESNTIVLHFIEYKKQLKADRSSNVIVKMLRKGYSHDE